MPAEPEPLCVILDVYGPCPKNPVCRRCCAPTPHIMCKVRVVSTGEVTLLGVCQICSSPQGYKSAWKNLP